MNIIKFASINFSILLLWAINPYPRWMLPSEFSLIVLLLTTIISVVLLYSSNPELIKFDKYRRGLIFMIILFVIYFDTSLVHDMRWGHIVFYSSFALSVLLDDKIFFFGFIYFKKIIVAISLLSLICWVLNLMNIPIPYYHYVPDFRSSITHYYRIYGPAISLYDGSAPIGGGIDRICGVFAEPGHFGIYLGYIMSISGFRFNKKSDIILLFAGVLTFSTAFYGILGLGILYRLLKDRKLQRDIKRFLVAMTILISPFLILNSQKLYDNVIGRVVDGRNIENVFDLIENRALDHTKVIFDQFSNSSKSLVGNGYYYDDEVIQVTNWRGFVFEFGFLGAAIMLFFIIYIIKRTNILYCLLLLSVTVLVFSHRSYLFYAPTFYMLLFVAVTVNKVVYSKQQTHKGRDSINSYWQ